MRGKWEKPYFIGVFGILIKTYDIKCYNVLNILVLDIYSIHAYI